LGLPYIIKQALGNTTGNVFLIDSAIAITVCTLAVCTACIRMLFSMARDGRLPAGSHLARVSGRARVPIIPALFVGFCSLALLGINLANQSAFLTLTSVAIIMFYLPYLAVTGSMLRRRLRGEWPRPEHGPYFNLGRWGLPVNIFAVVYGTLIAFEIAWPRAAVYGTKWYFRFGAYEFIGASFIVGCLYYFLVQTRKPPEVLAEHRAEVPVLAGEPPPLGGAAAVARPVAWWRPGCPRTPRSPCACWRRDRPTSTIRRSCAWRTGCTCSTVAMTGTTRSSRRSGATASCATPGPRCWVAARRTTPASPSGPPRRISTSGRRWAVRAGARPSAGRRSSGSRPMTGPVKTMGARAPASDHRPAPQPGDQDRLLGQARSDRGWARDRGGVPDPGPADPGQRPRPP